MARLKSQGCLDDNSDAYFLAELEKFDKEVEARRTNVQPHTPAKPTPPAKSLTPAKADNTSARKRTSTSFDTVCTSLEIRKLSPSPPPTPDYKPSGKAIERLPLIRPARNEPKEKEPSPPATPTPTGKGNKKRPNQSTLPGAKATKRVRLKV